MAETYNKSDMVYTDCKWIAKADHDNPKIIGGTDHAELNRTEGYEMQYFIKSIAKTWQWTEPNLPAYKRLEIIIRTKVPNTVRTHSGIRDWIATNYKEI